MKHLALIALAAALALTAPLRAEDAKADAKPDAKPEKGGWFVYAISSDVTSFNPYLSTNNDTTKMIEFIYNRVLRFNDKLELEGDLADKWEVAPDNKTYTFWLKKGVKWHDGQELTVDDVEFTLNYIKNPSLRTVRRTYVNQLVDDPKDKNKVAFKKIDAHSFSVTYKQPFCPALSHWAEMMILPKHVLEGKDPNDNQYAIDKAKPIGSGPLKYESNKTDEQVTLAANDDYFKGRPNFDKVIFRIVPKIEVVLSNLEARQVDYGEVNLIGVFKFVAQNQAIKDAHNVMSWDLLSYAYLAWNCDPNHSKLFSDKRVRQAMSYGIDMAKLIKRTTFGKAIASNGPFHPRFWAADPSVSAYPYDPEKAKKLLEEAGWKDADGDGILEKDGQKFEFTLRYPPASQQITDRMALIKTDLSKIGVNCKTEGTEWTVLLKNFIMTKNFDSAYLAWSLSLEPDPYQIWHSDSIPLLPEDMVRPLAEDKRAAALELIKKVQQAADDKAREAALAELATALGKPVPEATKMVERSSGFNRVSYANAEVDKLIIDAQQTCDRDTRQKAYRRMHQIIMDESPYTFMFIAPQYTLLDKRVHWHRDTIESSAQDPELGTVVNKLPPTEVWTEDFVLKSWIPASERRLEGGK